MPSNNSLDQWIERHGRHLAVLAGLVTLSLIGGGMAAFDLIPGQAVFWFGVISVMGFGVHAYSGKSPKLSFGLLLLTLICVAVAMIQLIDNTVGEITAVSFVALGTIYIALSWKTVPVAHVGVLFFMDEPVRVKEPGWRMAWWLLCKLELEKLEVETDNIQISDVQTTMEPVIAGQLLVFERDKAVTLKCDEISFKWRPYPYARKDDDGQPIESEAAALKRYYQYKDADWKRLRELARDLVHGSLREKMSRVGLLSATTNGAAIVKTDVFEELKGKIREQGIPIEPISLIQNKAFLPAEPSVLAQFNAIAGAELREKADEIDAGRQIKILGKLAQAYGMKPPTEGEEVTPEQEEARQQLLLRLRELDVLEKFATSSNNTTFLPIPANLHGLLGKAFGK